MQGMSKSGFAGDFGTPEQEIGNYNPDIPWESCITIGKQWAWKPNDQLKSVKQLIHTLVLTAGGGGNLLLNVGPMLDGRIEQRQIDSLKQVGNWLDKYGESIYGTSAGPYMPNEWMASTSSQNKVYLHLLKWPEGKLTIPTLKGYKIKSIGLMQGSDLTFEEKKGELIINLPSQAPDPNSSVIVIEFNKTLNEATPIKMKK